MEQATLNTNPFSDLATDIMKEVVATTPLHIQLSQQVSAEFRRRCQEAARALEAWEEKYRAFRRAEWRRETTVWAEHWNKEFADPKYSDAYRAKQRASVAAGVAWWKQYYAAHGDEFIEGELAQLRHGPDALIQQGGHLLSFARERWALSSTLRKLLSEEPRIRLFRERIDSWLRWWSEAPYPVRSAMRTNGKVRTVLADAGRAWAMLLDRADGAELATAMTEKLDKEMNSLTEAAKQEPTTPLLTIVAGYTR